MQRKKNNLDKEWPKDADQETPTCHRKLLSGFMHNLHLAPQTLLLPPHPLKALRLVFKKLNVLKINKIKTGNSSNISHHIYTVLRGPGMIQETFLPGFFKLYC